MHLSSWISWGVILVIQNWAFTFTSRARNSGSLSRHAVAGVFSNGIWFVSQMFIFSKMFDMMTGKYGLTMAIFTGVFYTVLTLSGSILAHYYALHSEKGKSAVGASKKYVQITPEEWEKVKALVDNDSRSQIPA